MKEINAAYARGTGLDEKTIRRGRREMEEWLVNRSVDRVRVEGGGRPVMEKKPGS